MCARRSVVGSLGLLVGVWHLMPVPPVLGQCGSSAVICVDKSATGSADGGCWTDAYTDLQDALDCARDNAIHPVPVTGIWVATASTAYYPVPCASPPCAFTPSSPERLTSFELVDGVALYGGFDGTESSLGARSFGCDSASDNPGALCSENPDCPGGTCLNPTILSGDINNDDSTGGSTSENSYHVVRFRLNAINTATLDGFTITAGLANGTSTNAKQGAGLTVDGTGTGSLTVRNCRFDDNHGIFAGGAVALNLGSTSTFEDCWFGNNCAPQGGGGPMPDGPHDL